MPKINQEEYEILKGLDDKWEWIARDNDNTPWIYTKKPRKDTWGRWQIKGILAARVDINLFQFIQWEVPEPYNISELIEEYEGSQMTYFDRKLISEYEWLTKESEETEVKKDKKWAQKEVDRYLSYEGVNEARNALAFAKGVINQLDEPEVLSSDWIDEYAQGDYDEWVYTEDLQNLLVPKQELPVIPNYVAKWISVHHEQFDLYPALKRLENNALSWEDVYEWYRKNTRKFVSAYLTGKYVVEEEQKYVVKLPMSKNNDNQYAIVDYSGNIWIDALPSKYKLTEEEIRGLTKGDILFEHFAVKVEEMEE